MESKPIVSIENLTKVIKGRTIIDDLSFDVYRGEVFGFLGPNGAGKTTTIRMIVGLMSITSGDIKIDGFSIQKNFEKAVQSVGAIVENPEMYKFLSGYQNLQQYARMVGGVSKAKIDEIVDLVGLSERIDDKVKTYSLGMRQRLGLAQCLLHDPAVLILDEPTNGLDPAGIREIRDYLRFLAKEKNMAVIVSSHILSEMEMMCDRIGIIQNGKLVDVQQVKEFVQGAAETIVEFEVTPLPQAISVLGERYPNLSIQKGERTITLTIAKELIPDIIKAFVHTDLKVYGVRELTKTLEDRFLEITKGDGGKIL
ncbi:ABC transporter ATP-binding protein [Bacillus marasmi]|uniref:ABC transporter ATP-binding protein n=1 Tax=Bacillus marasmi TaxID=1926279 RepID=UPI0011CC0F78|nr:ABC transporter ATP-binding protein [Bacillus marasmi]